MKRTIILTYVVIISACAIGQPSQGEVTINKNAEVDTILARYDQLNAEYLENPDNKGITGYRVQIFFDSGNYSGDRAREAREDFEEKYDDIPVYITWKAPNYRVRVGDFRDRLDAERFLQKIAKDYPNAWVIKDDINFPEIN
jgi:hypothetical protein